jgi:hypothetical protein
MLVSELSLLALVMRIEYFSPPFVPFIDSVCRVSFRRKKKEEGGKKDEAKAEKKSTPKDEKVCTQSLKEFLF